MSDRTKALEESLAEMLKVYEMLMPGKEQIATHDYHLVIGAAVRARRLLESAESAPSKARR